MMRVELENDEAYGKAFRVLWEVGGTFHGLPDRVLLVSEDQYKALVRAKVIAPNGVVEKKRDRRTSKKTDESKGV